MLTYLSVVSGEPAQNGPTCMQDKFTRPSKKRKAVWAFCVCVLGIMGTDAPNGTPVWTPYLSSVVIGSLFSLISCFS